MTWSGKLAWEGPLCRGHKQHAPCWLRPTQAFGVWLGHTRVINRMTEESLGTGWGVTQAPPISLTQLGPRGLLSVQPPVSKQVKIMKNRRKSPVCTVLPCSRDFPQDIHGLSPTGQARGVRGLLCLCPVDQLTSWGLSGDLASRRLRAPCLENESDLLDA